MSASHVLELRALGGRQRVQTAANWADLSGWASWRSHSVLLQGQSEGFESVVQP